MVFLDRERCTSWLVEHEIPTNEEGRPSPALAFEEGVRIWLPDELTARLVFCKWLWRMVAEDDTTLLWVTDWSIWESSEHMPLATAVRRGLGTTASLLDAPGCVVERHESDDGLSLFLVATLFSWDSWVATSAQPHALIFTSHDDYVDVYLPAGRQLTDVEHFKLAIETVAPE